MSAVVPSGPAAFGPARARGETAPASPNDHRRRAHNPDQASRARRWQSLDAACGQGPPPDAESGRKRRGVAASGI